MTNGWKKYNMIELADPNVNCISKIVHSICEQWMITLKALSGTLSDWSLHEKNYMGWRGNLDKMPCTSTKLLETSLLILTIHLPVVYP